ncbi:hypothetical protein EWM64_g1381 [Hericium alpestre]|uniref:F-box domain-containing protein n=1 Tax=Hericium alpestre TaxID=135208 RepID=A0A4Z0A8M6_9AGAM|nr:hypothetical protein EWM64_g1381 [Hericium alpestre]
MYDLLYLTLLTFAEDPREFWLASVQSRLAHIQDVRPLQTNSVVGALKTLDNELAAVHLAMCSLRTRRNALLPISSLPPEVLARIFHFYSVAEPPPYRRPPQIGWIIVTHVCRAWRDTALQQPYLWSEATTGLGPKWLERMLARAKMQQIADIVRFVAVHANAGNPFLVLSISADSGLYCIEAWRSYSPPVLGHWFLRDDAPQADPDISVSLIRTDFEVLCAGLPFNDIRNLSIHLPDDPPSQTWIELFGRCKSIEHLSVGEGPTATSLVRALIGQGTAPGSLMPIMDISNTIRSLELRDVRSIDEETRMRICVAIQEWLRNRKQTGGRVPRLYLKSCSITYGEITISD